MAITLLGQYNIQKYFEENGPIDIEDISIISLTFLVQQEGLTIGDIAELFKTNRSVVEAVIARNGIQ